MASHLIQTGGSEFPRNQSNRPPPPRCPRSMPALMEELVEEILLRIPPDEPAHLFRATLVCKPWRRILSDPGFLRRYRTLHRAPPLLGYFRILNYGIFGFVSTTGAHPPLSPQLTFDNSQFNWVHDCRHGRVLIQVNDQLIVLDPITGDQKKLSVPKNLLSYCASAVLCAVDGCDHLDCHAGPFLVVYCTTYLGNTKPPFKTWATTYSSETKEWSALISTDVNHGVDSRHSCLIRNALYFSLDNGINMLKYDLIRHELSVASSPNVRWAVAMELDDEGLGFVAVLDRCIYRWSWQADANNGIGKWVEHMVMQLDTLLTEDKPHYYYRVVGLVEGTDIIFIRAYAGLFTLDLKSKKVKKIGKREDYYRVIPYMSFYTRDLAKGGQSL